MIRTALTISLSLCAVVLPAELILHPIELEGYRRAAILTACLLASCTVIAFWCYHRPKLVWPAVLRRLLAAGSILLSFPCFPYWLISYAYHPVLMPLGIGGYVFGIGHAAFRRRLGWHWVLVGVNWMTFADVMTFRIPHNSHDCRSLKSSGQMERLYDNFRPDHPDLNGTIPYDFVIDPEHGLLAISHESVFWRTRKSAAVSLRNLADGSLRSVIELDRDPGCGLYAERLALDIVRSHLYVATNGPAGFCIQQVDLSAGPPTAGTPLKVAGEIHEMEIAGDRLVVLYWESKRSDLPRAPLGEIFELPSLRPLLQIESPVGSPAPGSLQWAMDAYWFALPGPVLGRIDPTTLVASYTDGSLNEMGPPEIPSRFRGGFFPPALAFGGKDRIFTATTIGGTLRACEAARSGGCRTVRVGGMPRAAIVDGKSETLLMGGYASGRITALDARTLEVRGHRDVGRLIRRLRTTPDGTLYSNSECGVFRMPTSSLFPSDG